MCDNCVIGGVAVNRQRLHSQFNEAISSGHLMFFESKVYKITDQGYPFFVRFCPGLVKKEFHDFSITKNNPFLPYDPNLLIEKLELTGHVLLFNKFSLVTPHVLLITESFQPQDKTCTWEDFEAVGAFYERYGDNFVMFYNCGPKSGASQPHRHFQFIPDEDCGVPFLGKRAPCAAKDLFDTYRELLESVESNSFNLLFSPKWGLCLIERSAERCSLEISINSMGFLGCLLVKREKDVERLIETGPFQVLTEIIQTAQK